MSDNPHLKPGEIRIALTHGDVARFLGVIPPPPPLDGEISDCLITSHEDLVKPPRHGFVLVLCSFVNGWLMPGDAAHITPCVMIGRAPYSRKGWLRTVIPASEMVRFIFDKRFPGQVRQQDALDDILKTIQVYPPELHRLALGNALNDYAQEIERGLGAIMERGRKVKGEQGFELEDAHGRLSEHIIAPDGRRAKLT